MNSKELKREGNLIFNESQINSSTNKKKKEKIFLEWSNINYTINDDNMNKNTKVFSDQEAFFPDHSINSIEYSNNHVILNKIEGFAVPNELLVIMGPSGSGKTTFLNILANRQLSNDKNHIITRQVKANNLLLDETNFGNICAYVMQEDILMEYCTPRESLTFVAKIKLNASEEKIVKRVNRLLKKFGLEKCADSYIGSVIKKGISGGERKRTSIACEIISNPRVVILDEPTTGLDSVTSLLIIKYLKQLASTGKTIICTIHQPCSTIFELIDRLILLKDGYLFYQGRCNDASKYFEAIKMPVPQYCNPADYFLEVISSPKLSAKDWNIKYLKFCESEVRNEQIKLHEKYKNKEIFNNDSLGEVNWYTEYILLLKRTSLNYVRDKSLFIIKIINIFICSFILGAAYYKIGSDEKKINLYQNYTSFFFNNTSFIFFNAMNTSVYMLPILKPVLRKENSSKLYRLSSFYFSLITSLFINSLIFSIIYTTITFLGIQFFVSDQVQNLEYYMLLFLMNFINFTIGQYMGIFIGVTFSEQVVNLLIPLFSILFYFGCGYYRSNETIPTYFSWILYMSPYRYFMEIEVKIFGDYNEITRIIPEKLGFSYGYLVCCSSLLGITLIILLLGYLGTKHFTAKF